SASVSILLLQSFPTRRLSDLVVKNFTANGMLAVGASPIMSGEKSEAEDLMKAASGLLINIGTADEMKKDLMAKMISEANRNDIRSEEHTLNSSHVSISYAVFC